jgi:hypothetical protein
MMSLRPHARRRLARVLALGTAALLAQLVVVGPVRAADPPPPLGSTGGFVVAAYQSVPGPGCHSYPFSLSMSHGTPHDYYDWTGLWVSVRRLGGAGVTVVQPRLGGGPDPMLVSGSGAFVHCAPPAGLGIYEITVHVSGITLDDVPQPDSYSYAYTELRMRSATSLMTSASTVPRGSTYRVGGRVVCRDPVTFVDRPAPAAYVQLWFERAGTRTYVLQGYVWTNSLGVYTSRPLQTGWSGSWQATWAGNATCFRSASSPRWVTVT